MSAYEYLAFIFDPSVEFLECDFSQMLLSAFLTDHSLLFPSAATFEFTSATAQMYTVQSKPTWLTVLEKDRHPHSRLPISKRRHLRQKYPSRLAEHLHLPPRIIPLFTHKSPPCLLLLRISHPLPRHDDSLLLRHETRRSNKSACGHLSGKGPESIHWPRLHGLRSQSRLPPRRVPRTGRRRYKSNNRPHRLYRSQPRSYNPNHHTSLRTLLLFTPPRRPWRSRQRIKPPNPNASKRKRIRDRSRPHPLPLSHLLLPRL